MRSRCALRRRELPGCPSATAVAVGPAEPEAALAAPVSGLAPDTLYRWRAAVQHAPPVGPLSANLPHGPWRRVQAQAVEADLRTGDGANGPACGDGAVDSGEECDDGNVASGDGCDAQCQVESACPAAPADDCLSAAKASLSVDERKAGNEKLSASLGAFAAETAAADFGDPVSGGTRYDLCIYDGAGGRAVGLAVARAGAACGPKAKPCWKASKGKGWRYQDPDGSSDGVRKLSATAGKAGKGKLALQASNRERKGQTALPSGIAAALVGETAVTLQLHASGAACYSAALGTVQKADGVRFRAKAP